ncbi:MAG: carbohydrate ABC transporter permease [Clostridia bacterium]|nr:carbohydrate ABC transporter permease [Clostridia bacterium]
MKRTKGEKIFNVFNIALLSMFAIVCLYPFWYTAVLSISSTADAVKEGLHLFTLNPDLNAYRQVLSDENILFAYGNTLFRTILGTALALLVTLMYAYGLSRKEMPARRLLSFLLIFTMLFSGGTIPTYLIIKNLKLLDNRWVYILPCLITAYNAIIARSFFMSIPESLHESAILDGASEFRIFFGIYIPLSKPIIMTLLLWIAVGHWNSWYDAMIYINDDSKIPMQLLLQRMVENSRTTVMNSSLDASAVTVMPATIRSATIIVAVLPILAVYPFIQKYFMSGVMLGAVKG